jgi:hypothetical protein
LTALLLHVNALQSKRFQSAILAQLHCTQILNLHSKRQAAAVAQIVNKKEKKLQAVSGEEEATAGAKKY